MSNFFVADKKAKVEAEKAQQQREEVAALLQGRGEHNVDAAKLRGVSFQKKKNSEEGATKTISEKNSECANKYQSNKTPKQSRSLQTKY